MSLSSRLIALQGFQLTPLALALQGIFDAGITAPEQPIVRRKGVVGRGPGTTINLSQYLEMIKRTSVIAPTPAPLAIPPKKRKSLARAREEEILLLCEV